MISWGKIFVTLVNRIIGSIARGIGAATAFSEGNEVVIYEPPVSPLLLMFYFNITLMFSMGLSESDVNSRTKHLKEEHCLARVIRCKKTWNSILIRLHMKVYKAVARRE